MNRTYNIVWSHARNAFIVASEHAKAKGKPTTLRKGIVSAVAAALLAMAGAPALAAVDCLTPGAITIDGAATLNCALGATDSLTVSGTGSIIEPTTDAVTVGTGVISITVDTGGVIESVVNGINVPIGGTISGDITNNGTINSTGFGNAINFTGGGSLTGDIINYHIVSGANNGIALSASTIAGSIVNNNGGTISGSNGGIFVASTSDITSGITNNAGGTISGGNGGIIVASNGDISGGITNNAGGTISGSTNVGIMVASTGHISGGITNSGTISGLDAGIWVGTSSDITGGITNNSGGTISASGSIMNPAYGIRVSSGSTVSAITNNGMISAAGVSSSSAILVAGIAALSGSNITSIVNTGTIQSTITMNGSSTAWGAGIAVSDSGSTIGTITNSGTISGNTRDGILVRSSGAVTTGIVNQAGGTITGNRGIVITNNSSVGSITNAGTISSNGGFAIVIDSSSTMTGSIINNAGGVISGGLNIQTTTNVNNAGTITLPAGTAFIGGDYTQTAGGVSDKGLQIDVTDDTTYGQLVVAGTATLPTNAKFKVNVDDPNFAFTATSLTDVLTAGTLTWDGTSVVTDNSVLFDFTATKNGNAIDLILCAAGTCGGGGGGSSGVLNSVTTVGNTPGKGAATVLDTLVADFAGGGTGNADMDTVIGALGALTNDEQVSAAVSSTLPLMTGGMAQATSANLNGVNRVLQARMEEHRGMSSGEGFVENGKGWFKPVGSWADQKNSDGAFGYTAETYGVVMGADGERSDVSRMGAAFGYTHSLVHGNSGAQSAKVDSYQFVAYGSRSLNESTEYYWQADYAYNQNKGSRFIAFVNRTAVADYTSNSLHLGTGIGKTMVWKDKTSFVPSVRADYTRIADGAYTETGANALNLVVASKTTEELILSVDGKLAHSLSDTATLTANVGLGYDAMAKQNSITASYAGGGAAFTTDGIKPSASLVRAGLGYVHNTDSGMEITARYDAEARTGFTAQTVSAKLRMAF